MCNELINAKENVKFMATKLHRTLPDKLNTEDLRVMNKFQAYVWIGSYVTLSCAHTLTEKAHLKKGFDGLGDTNLTADFSQFIIFICATELAKNKYLKCLCRQYQLPGQKYPTCYLHLKEISSTYSSKIKNRHWNNSNMLYEWNIFPFITIKKIWTATPFYVIFHITFNISKSLL